MNAESSLRDERTELQKDEEKLQTALQTYDDGWASFYDYEEEEDDEDDEQLIIDLEREYTESERTADASNKSSFAESGSIPANASADGELTGATSDLKLGLPPETVATSQQTSGPEQVLALNRALQGILEGHIEAISNALEENRAKQRELEEDETDKLDKVTIGAASAPFRAPYFKSDFSFPPPNEDVLLKRQSNEPKTDLSKDYIGMRAKSRAVLKQAVVEDCLEQMIKPLLIKHEEEVKKQGEIESAINALETEVEVEKNSIASIMKLKKSEDAKKELKKEARKRVKDMSQKIEELREQKKPVEIRIAEIEKEMEEKKATPDEELLANVDSEKVDWMKISKLKFGGTTSWLDCQKAWDHVVRDDINSVGWKEEEENRLRELVDSSNNDWSDIAQKLGTKRTPFQCFSHYQTHLNPELQSRKWTPEEEKKLVDVTKKVRASLGTHSWKKVAAFMDCRSPTECMIRFSRLDENQNHGRWSYEEDAKLLAGVNMVGQSWAKVAKFVGTRNMVQCRDRYMNSLDPGINFSHFTYDEDAKLLRLYKEKGSEWCSMVPEFKGRTDSMLQKRYKTLQKFRRQWEWFENQDEMTKDMLLGKNLSIKERKQKEMEVKEFMSNELGVVQQDYTRRYLDQQRGVDPDLIPPRPPFQLKYNRTHYNFERNNYISWLRKLQMHKHLTKNLNRLIRIKRLKSYQLGKQGENPPDGGDIRTQLKDKEIREIVEESVQQTMKERPDAVINTDLSEKQIEDLKGKLNKIFLGLDKSSVQDLITMCSDKTPDKVQPGKPRRKTSFAYNTVVMRELKAYLLKISRTNARFGRRRQFFAKDWRDSAVIEAERQMTMNLVPRTLIKTLGTSLDYLLGLTRLRKLDLEEQLLNFPNYQDDPTYKIEMDYANEVKSRLFKTPKMPQAVAAVKEKKLKAKIRKMEKLFKEKYDLEKRQLEQEVWSYANDIRFLESLMINLQDGMDEEEGMRLLSCHASPDSDSNFVLSSLVESGFLKSFQNRVSQLTTKSSSIGRETSKDSTGSSTGGTSAESNNTGDSSTITHQSSSSSSATKLVPQTSSSSSTASSSELMSQTSLSSSSTASSAELMSQNTSSSAAVSTESAQKTSSSSSSSSVTTTTILPVLPLPSPPSSSPTAAVSIKDSVSQDSNSASSSKESGTASSLDKNIDVSNSEHSGSFKVPAPKQSTRSITGSEGKGKSSKVDSENETGEEKEEVKSVRSTRSRKKPSFWAQLQQAEKPNLRKREQKTEKKPLKKKKLSLEEILKEKESMSGDLPKKIFSKLPFLPPNLSTLSALRSLLLSRTKLIETAGDLYKPPKRQKTVLAILEEESTEKKKTDLLADSDHWKGKVNLDSAGKFNDGHSPTQHPEFDVLQESLPLNQQKLEKEMTRLKATKAAALIPTMSYPQEDLRKLRLDSFLKDTAKLALSRKEVENLTFYPGIDLSNLPGKSTYNVVIAPLVSASRAGCMAHGPVESNREGDQFKFPSYQTLPGTSSSGQVKSATTATLSGSRETGETVDEVQLSSNNSDDVIIVRSNLQNFQMDSSRREVPNKSHQQIVKHAVVKSSRLHPSQSPSTTSTPLPQLTAQTAKSQNPIFLNEPPSVSQNSALKNSPNRGFSSKTQSETKRPTAGANASTGTINISSLGSEVSEGSYFSSLSQSNPSFKSCSKSNMVLHKATVVHKSNLDGAEMSNEMTTGDEEIIEIVADPLAADSGQSLQSSFVSQHDNKTEPKSVIPKETVERIMHTHRLKNSLNKIVIVGVDSQAKKVVHYKADSDDGTIKNFKPVTCRLIGATDNKMDNPPKQPENNFDIQAVRNTEEYKLLLARFRSVFTWPVVLSTAQPKEPKEKPASPIQKKKKQMNIPMPGKLSKAQKRHYRSVRKKNEQKRKRMRQTGDKEGTEKESGDKEMNSQPSTSQAETEKREMMEKETGDDQKPGPSKSSSDKEKETNETGGASQAKRARGKGSNPRKKYVKVERNLRKTKQMNYEFPKIPKVDQSERKQRLPQWWKDAMVAAMLSKQQSDQTDSVNIEQDEDFVDKGQYSDDEWLAELKEQEEKKKAVKKRGRKRKNGDEGGGDGEGESGRDEGESGRDDAECV